MKQASLLKRVGKEFYESNGKIIYFLKIFFEKFHNYKTV